MFDITSVLLILLVALGTYFLRLSGLLLSNKFAKDGKVKLFLDYLPATLLLALVIPSIIKEGLIGLFAAILIAVCMYKTKSILLSMCLGIFVVALSRNYSIL